MLLEILVYVVAIVIVVLLGWLVDGILSRPAQSRLAVEAGRQQERDGDVD